MRQAGNAGSARAKDGRRKHPAIRAKNTARRLQVSFEGMMGRFNSLISVELDRQRADRRGRESQAGGNHTKEPLARRHHFPSIFSRARAAASAISFSSLSSSLR